MDAGGRLQSQPARLRSGVGVIVNTGKDAGYAFTREVCAFLASRGAAPVLTERDAEAAGLPEYGAPGERLYGETAFIAVLGGDGTILRASHMAAIYRTPMLGINLGTSGFLTDIEKNGGLGALSKALSGDYRMDERLMLTVRGDNAGGLADAEKLALNDVYLSRGGFGKLIVFDLLLNGMYIDTLRADGMIISTPTGSTAYNLSAGGPILAPGGDMMVITAVCPHNLHNRPLVIAAGDIAEIRPLGEPAVTVSLDGEYRLSLNSGQRLLIKRADYTAQIIKTAPENFYSVLRSKMRYKENEEQTPK